AANETIAQSVPAQPSAASPGSAPLRVAATAHSAPAAAARRGPAPLPGQTDRTQAKFEAKAKISWGDPPRDVLVYLMSQGFSREEASEFVQELFRERALVIRAKGIKNIAGGIALICIPLISYIIFMALG